MKKGSIILIAVIVIAISILVGVSIFAIKNRTVKNNAGPEITNNETNNTQKQTDINSEKQQGETSSLTITIKEGDEISSNGAVPTKQYQEDNLVILVPIKTSKIPNVSEIQVIVTFPKQNPEVKNLICDLSDSKDKCAVYLTWEGIYNEFDFRTGKLEIAFMDNGFIEAKMDICEYYSCDTASAYIKGTLRLKT